MFLLIFFSLSSLQFLNFPRITFVLWIIHYLTILSLLHVFLRVFLLCNLFFVFYNFLVSLLVYYTLTLISPSVQFNLSVVLTLWPHRLQHTRLPCPSPRPRACSNSCPSSWWCLLTISSSVVPSPPAFNLPQHQGLFHWVSSLHQMTKELMLLNCGIGEDSWESLGLQEDQTCQS